MSRRLVRVGILPTSQFYTIMTSTHNSPRRWNRRGQRVPGDTPITPEEEAAGFADVGLVDGDVPTVQPSQGDTVRILRGAIDKALGDTLDSYDARVLHDALNDLDFDSDEVVEHLSAVAAFLAGRAGDREAVRGILAGDDEADDVGIVPLITASAAAAPAVSAEIARRDTPQGIISMILRLQSRVDKLRKQVAMPAATWAPIPKVRPRVVQATPQKKGGLVALGEGMSALAKAVTPREAPKTVVGSFGPVEVGAFETGERIDSVTPDRGLWAVDTDGHRQRV